MSGTIAQLKEIKELLDGGVLTQQEFDAQKTLILEKPKITQVAPAPVAPAPVAPVVGQPAMMQAGMMQPGMMQPGMMQPGMMQPGMMQPGMMQPGMSMPGIYAQLWNGPPPPNEARQTWFEMYLAAEGRSKIGPDGRFTRGGEPGDCQDCLYAMNCMACAAGEYVQWASNGGQSAECGGLAFVFCPLCVVIDARKKMEHKIWQFHSQRGGAHA